MPESTVQSLDEKAIPSLISITGERKYTAMGDGGHGSLANEQLLANPKFMDGLEQKGIKHIFLEVDEARQPDMDAFMRGEIDATELSQRVGVSKALDPQERDLQANLQQQFFSMAKERDIKIHFIDPQVIVPENLADVNHAKYKLEKAYSNGNIHSEAEAETFLKDYGVTLKQVEDLLDNKYSNGKKRMSQSQIQSGKYQERTKD
ncbi:MAG: hypothetical protein H6855_01485 [Rhodospirillales bacterium]|nr:hypothetical protein [Rhodospirillales bacterium]MCB9964742.1 hypothetical protein [Rhodospirillales bacterium]MCB9980610.1 hypothetical protein [Rhodospirillales bacterium]